MLNFLAHETQATLEQESALLRARSSRKKKSVRKANYARQQKLHHEQNIARMRQRIVHSGNSLQHFTEHQPIRNQSQSMPFFPGLGIPWHNENRRKHRNKLRNRKLQTYDYHHKKILKVMRSVDPPPPKKAEPDIWDDPVVNQRALDWFRIQNSKTADQVDAEIRMKAAKKEENWFFQGKRHGDEKVYERKKYVPPPPKPKPGPHHPRMLQPVPAVSCEPVSHTESAKVVMKAIASREYYYGLFERTMLLSRAKGMQYLGGPVKLLRRYFQLFEMIVVWTVKVCRAIEEWRYQLSQLGNVPFHATSVVPERQPFMWGGERKTAKGATRRYHGNYLLKLRKDVQVLLKAEMPGVPGKKPELIIKKAGISGDYVHGVSVCPLLLNVTLHDLVTSFEKCASFAASAVDNPKSTPCERWYDVAPQDILFAARMILEEENHAAMQEKIMKPDIVEMAQLEVSRTSAFGPSVRTSVDAVGSVVGSVARSLIQLEHT